MSKQKTFRARLLGRKARHLFHTYADGVHSSCGLNKRRTQTTTEHIADEWECRNCERATAK